MVRRLINFIKSKLRGEFTTEQLIKMGLKVGENFSRQNGVIIDPFHCWLIRIGDNVTLAPRVHILAHDASTKIVSNYTKIGKVIIGNNVFIGASALILPGVKIGDNVIVGAGSIVVDDVPSNCIAVGSPARVIKSIDEYSAEVKELMKKVPVYDKKWTISGGISPCMKAKQFNELNEVIGFVE